jgi:diguanylate cyclase (GGDEF)-like protein
MRNESRVGGAVRLNDDVKQNVVAESAREMTLAARESSVLAREQAMVQREEAATATAAHSALSDMQIREANQQLVIASVRALEMTEAAERATQQMSHKAERDFLTGLPNRALLTDRLAQAIELARRHIMRVALLYIDVDLFKRVNDSLGHTVGDQLLQSVAKRLQACVRHSDTVSRQGGDEFVVLLTETETPQDATLVAEKLIRAIAEPHIVGEHRLLVTVSIGISIYPDDGEKGETVLINAEAAMYCAKRNGGNNFQRFTLDVDTDPNREHSL